MTKIKCEMGNDWILEEMMKVAMTDERSDHEKYRKLASMAKKDHDRKVLSDISNDEKRHLKALRYLYHSLFGKEPREPHPHGEHLGGFTETIGKSIVNEYSGISFYREILGRICDDRMKMPIRQIMADEQKHAQILEGILQYK